MICASLSHDLVFYSSPSDFSLAYGIMALDLTKFSSWSFEVLPPPGPFPLAFLLLLVAPRPLAVRWRSSAISWDIFSLCSLLSGHLTQTHLCAASLSLLRPRTVFVSAVSTGRPGSTSIGSKSKSIILLAAPLDFHIAMNRITMLRQSGTKDLSPLDSSFSLAFCILTGSRAKAYWPLLPQCFFLLLPC